MEEGTFIQEKSIFDMVLGSGMVVQLVLLTLIALSVWSWAITIAKMLQLRKAKAHSDEFRNIFWESRNFSRIDDSTARLGASPLAHLFSSGYRELTNLLSRSGTDVQEPKLESKSDLESIERALKRAEFEQSMRLERGVTFLATVASAAPFIGLFGTVWGIMNAFHGLSQLKSTTLQAVAPGISEALVATAIGLAAAIPAAIAYNYFAVSLRRFRDAMQGFSAEFLNVAHRYFVK